MQRFFEDFRIGEIFRAPSKTLTDAHFLFFAGLTGDNHPIHYDVEYASGTRFGRPLAHGLLLVALTALGAGELSPSFEEAIVAFLDQSARFLGPAFVGDTLHPELEVAALEARRSTGVVSFTSRIRNQRGETILEGQHRYIVRKRVAEGGDAANRD
jgi:acyl dehydratase